MVLSEKKSVEILGPALPSIMQEVGEIGIALQQRSDLRKPPKEGMSTGAKSDLSIADELMQEEFLEKILNIEGLNELVMRAEEDTSSVSKFANEGEIYLGLDPLNGTSRYIGKSKVWEIVVSLFTRTRVLLSCSYAPALDIMVSVSDEDGVSINDPHSLKNNKPTNTILTRSPELIADYEALRILFCDHVFQVLKEEPEIDSIQSRIGRNLSVVFGAVGGVVVTHPSPDDGLLLPHLAEKSEGWDVVWFDELGNTVERPNLASAEFDEKKGYQYPGGYAVVNSNFTSYFENK